jgi:capsular exopolysaccharide synthesis family protein
MERIRQALKQAEEERARKKAGDTLHASRSEPAKSIQSRRHPHASEVAFQKTRVVDVSADILEQNRLVAALPEHELTDAYRILRTQVLQKLRSHGWQSVAVTSPASGSGKTLTAINLAISLAREINHTVLLADLDLRNPSVHKHFGYEPEYGLSDYLRGDAPLTDILFCPSVDRLVVLPGRESITNSAETLRSPRMVRLVQEVQNRYRDRVVIFDLPPILDTDDALAFAPYTQAMLMVAESGATKREELERALAILHDVPVIGTVLNKSALSVKKHRRKT